jgi:hypothetical protein
METYLAGNKIKYTGIKEVKHGGLFFEFEYLDGYKKGQKGWTQRAPK